MARTKQWMRLIAAVRRRLQTKISDMNPGARPTLRPGDSATFANDEKELGFEFPPLLKRLYGEIGNGGFGPGYGMIGLTGGVPDDLGQTAPESYLALRGNDPEPGWNWPVGLLPICHWGCAILSCIDCEDGNFRMRMFDPNAHSDGDWGDAFFDESLGFEEWIAAWAKGIDLSDRMYGERGPIKRILSARHAAAKLLRDE